jgi:16S rRNA U516 pseudouridylate synthase RsuA-like enzyme
LILSGQVCVNGQAIRELGSKADTASDKIEASGNKINAAECKIYLPLNKPPEMVSTLADPEGRQTLHNLRRGMAECVYSAENLEYPASGLVFLTNDGDFGVGMQKDWSNIEQVLSRESEMHDDADLEPRERNWREDANAAAAGRHARSHRELLVRSSHAQSEKRRDVQSLI